MIRAPEEKNFYNNEQEAQVFIDKSENSWLLRYFENKFIKNILKKYNDSVINVLDLGCGPGYITIALAKARPNWNIAAVDYSPFMLSHAKEKSLENKVNNIEWINSKAEDFQTEKKFDLILSHYSFSEFENPKIVLENIAKASKAGTVLEMVDVIRPRSFYLKIISAISKIFYGEKFNKIFVNKLKGSYTEKEIRDIFQPFNLKESYFKFSLPSRIICTVLL